MGVQLGSRQCEITTFRADRYDRVTRNPAVAYGDSLVDDLRRRDFTMNAMALSVPGRLFTDPFGGLADLARGLLRTPGTPCGSGGFSVPTTAERLGMALVPDEEHHVWALGPESIGGRALVTAQAPELVLNDLDGKEFRLSSLRGQKVVLVAWAPY